MPYTNNFQTDIDVTLGFTIPDRSGPGSNGNEKALCSPPAP